MNDYRKVYENIIEELLLGANGGLIIAGFSDEIDMRLLHRAYMSNDIFRLVNDEVAVMAVSVDVIANSLKIKEEFITEVTSDTASFGIIAYLSKNTFDNYKNTFKSKVKAHLYSFRDREDVIGLIATNQDVEPSGLLNAYRKWLRLEEKKRVFLYDYMPFLMIHMTELFDEDAIEDFAEKYFEFVDFFEKIYVVKNKGIIE